MSLWEFREKTILPLEPTVFADEGVLEQAHLQKVLARNISAIDPDLLVIAEEYSAWEDSRRRIDILALDREANLVVIELKRTEDGGHMDLQAIRYAAMVSTMTFAKAVEAFEHYLRRSGVDDDAEVKMLEFLEWDEPVEEDFANDVSIILASAEFSREITTAVLWLNSKYAIDIRCVRLKPYKLDERLVLDIQQIVPLREATEYQVQLREKAVEQRTARQGSRTCYDLTVAGRTYSKLPKNGLMLHIARAAVNSGVRPEELAVFLPHRDRSWVSVEGECSNEEFLQRLSDVRSVRGRPIDPKRYFTGPDELILFDGRTYAFTTQWGKGTVEVAKRVAASFGDLAIEVQPFGGEDPGEGPL